MGCSCHSGAGQLVLVGEGSVTVKGSGSATDPFSIGTGGVTPTLQLEVRDSATVNMTLFGSGTRSDPYVIRADTSSASSLRGLSDVSATPTVSQGAVPLWIGSPTGGRFEFRYPGTRYTTNANRGTGLYLGEVIRETDTQKRYEWDGSQWVDLAPATVPPSALDPTVLVQGGTLATSTDWNSLTSQSRIYRIAQWDAGKNTPAGAYNFGTLNVYVSGQSVSQEYFEHGGGTVWTRTKFNATDWNGWRQSASIGDVNGQANRISQEITDRQNGDNGLQGQINNRPTYDQLNNRSNEIYSQYDGGRLDGRYFTQGSINGAFAQRDNDIAARPVNVANAQRIAVGNALVNNFSSNGNGGFAGYVDVGWSGFNTVSVVATANSADTRGVYCMISNYTTTGCRVWVVRPNNAATGVNWIAVGNG